jgi:hypothetical protein
MGTTCTIMKIDTCIPVILFLIISNQRHANFMLLTKQKFAIRPRSGVYSSRFLYGIDSVPTNSATESDEDAGLARGSTSFHADSFAAGSAWPGNDQARALLRERSKHI